MKGNWKHKGKTKNKKKGDAVLQKYREAVDVFLKSKGGSEEAESDQRLRFVKKKSRKELRKEKRKMKKAKMKSHYEGKNTVSLPPSDEGNPKIRADKHQQPQTQKKKMEKTKKSHPSEPKDESDKSETPPPSKKGKRVNKLQETRKMALMEANEQEDREIKKLERCLGLNKRKNKKSLPQSFVADGLDYILGVLDSGSSAVGLYEDDDVDMETAKDNFKKLDDSQGSGEDPESEGEMASEGSDDDGEDEDDDMSNEEEADEDEELEDDQEGLNDSGGPDSEDEKEGETEDETDAPDTKTETVSADTCNI